MISRSSGQINQKSYPLSHQVLKILILKFHYIPTLLSAHRKNRGEPCVSCHLSIQNQLWCHPVPSFPDFSVFPLIRKCRKQQEMPFPALDKHLCNCSCKAKIPIDLERRVCTQHVGINAASHTGDIFLPGITELVWSSRRRLLPPTSHTTGHAVPHPAVQLTWHLALQRYSSAESKPNFFKRAFDIA